MSTKYNQITADRPSPVYNSCICDKRSSEMLFMTQNVEQRKELYKDCEYGDEIYTAYGCMTLNA